MNFPLIISEKQTVPEKYVRTAPREKGLPVFLLVLFSKYFLYLDNLLTYMYSTGEASLFLSFLASFNRSSALACDSLASRNILKGETVSFHRRRNELFVPTFNVSSKVNPLALQSSYRKLQPIQKKVLCAFIKNHTERKYSV